MSTPVSIKQMEQAREKAARRHRVFDGGLMPLSQPFSYYPTYNFRSTRYNVDFTKDKAGGSQYTSFEGSRRDGDSRRVARSLIRPSVEDVPLDVETDDYRVDPTKVICFSGKDNFLCNLYHAPMTIDGHEYSSVEHYYQACKAYTLGGSQAASRLRGIDDSGNVKTVTRRLLRDAGVTNEQVVEWKRSHAPVLLHHAITHKYVQNPELRSKLMETGDALLAQAYDLENIFATGCSEEAVIDWAKANKGLILKVPVKLDSKTMKYIPLVGEGKNVLGFIIMRVRDELRDLQEAKPESSRPTVVAAMQALQLDSTSKPEGDKIRRSPYRYPLFDIVSGE
ncbi:hypothetical protein AB6A40_003881 [Gnathostoma spinigerum]|uniref:NADAR domain-containing protein n=1 Tax=Gnathostoma spinigerum TaxID=75299 RepID=A0ABD6ED28_9BILA